MSVEERAGLTMYGQMINAQIRTGGELAISLKRRCPKDEDGCPLLPAEDVLALGELIHEAKDRGELLPIIKRHIGADW